MLYFRSMSSETLQELLRRRPFESFEVRMSNGDVFHVRHPEFAFINRSNLVIGDPQSDRVAICALLHIADIHTLQAA